MSKPLNVRTNWRFRSLAIGLGIGAALLHLIAASFPEAVERHYSTGIYPHIAQLLGLPAQVIPISVAEILLFIFAGVLVYEGVRAVASVLRGKRSFFNLLNRSIVRGVTWLALLVSFFVLAWGLNYHRPHLSGKLGYLDGEAESPARLVAAANYLAARMEVERPKLGEVVADIPYVLSLAPALADAMDERLKTPSGRFGWAHPRTLQSSWGIAHANVWGIYSPFTNEANINSRIPSAVMPFIVVHEVAHQRGWAREVDANVYAFFACETSEATAFRYSALLRGWQYVVGALAGSDPDLLEQVGRYNADGVFLPLEAGAQVEADLSAIARFVADHDGALKHAQLISNDWFLKANGESAGVRSYGQMVGALVQWHQGKMIEETDAR